MEIEAIIYYLILIDALSANIVAWTGFGKQLLHSSVFVKRHLPITRGWAVLYLVLVLWLGFALIRLEIIL